MNRAVFALAAWIFIGLEWGLRDALQVGRLNVAPSFVLMLATLVALWASPQAAVGSAIVLGLAMDLLYQVPHANGSDVVVLGPHALGLLFGAVIVLNVRALAFRKNALTLAVLCLLAGIGAATVETMTLSVRAMYDPIRIGRPIAELLQRSGTALATAIVALPLGFVLTRFRRVFGFASDKRGTFRIESRGI